MDPLGAVGGGCRRGPAPSPSRRHGVRGLRPDHGVHGTVGSGAVSAGDARAPAGYASPLHCRPVEADRRIDVSLCRGRQRAYRGCGRSDRARRSAGGVGTPIEYAAGFLVGWLVFQALFMKDMVGGSYRRAVGQMFFPEWLSLNGVMAGMGVVVVLGTRAGPKAPGPGPPRFGFLMSGALAAGAVVAYPLNWWLVAHRPKTWTDEPRARRAADSASCRVSEPPATPGFRRECGAAPGHLLTGGRRLSDAGDRRASANLYPGGDGGIMRETDIVSP